MPLPTSPTFVDVPAPKTRMTSNLSDPTSALDKLKYLVNEVPLGHDETLLLALSVESDDKLALSTRYFLTEPSERRKVSSSAETEVDPVPKQKPMLPL